MRSGIENKKNRVTSLLFKIDIASTPTFSVQTAHFHKAVHRFALVLCMPSVCDLSSKFKENGICIHTLLGVPISYQPRIVILLPIHFVSHHFKCFAYSVCLSSFPCQPLPAWPPAKKAFQANRERDNRQREQGSLNPKTTVWVIPVGCGIGQSPENVCTNEPFGFRIEFCVEFQQHKCRIANAHPKAD